MQLEINSNLTPFVFGDRAQPEGGRRLDGTLEEEG